MIFNFLNSAERISAEDITDNYIFQRSLLAYAEASKLVSGKVLEIGTGTGYGINHISESSSEFVTIDKENIPIELAMTNDKVKFLKLKAPSLKGMPSNYFDFVISFQVIEHIKDDELFLKEAKRVLKKGGKLIISTPNKFKTLTRNPWHIREYSPKEFINLSSRHFNIEYKGGVYGDKEVMSYYDVNKEKVESILKLDIFKFHKWLPNILLQLPYDIANRINRKSLSDKGLHISLENYYLDKVSDESLDLFFILKKSI